MKKQNHVTRPAFTGQTIFPQSRQLPYPAATGTEKPSLLAAGDPPAERVLLTSPPCQGTEARRHSAQQGSGTPAGVGLFGCGESLQTTGQGTRRQLEARPEPAAPCPGRTTSLGLVCRRICSQVCSADPFATDQLPPSTQVLISSWQRDYFLLSVQTEEEDKSYHTAPLYEERTICPALLLDFCPHSRGLPKGNSNRKKIIICLMKNHLTQIS